MLNEVLRIFEMLDLVVFKHIYRERNSLADDLTKASTLIQEGFWHIMGQRFFEITKTNMPF